VSNELRDGKIVPAPEALIDVIAVHARPNWSLLVLFENGDLRRFDMTPFLDKSPFPAFRNPDVFRQANVDHGTVVWLGGISIPSKTLYDQSQPTGHPLDDLRSEFPLIFRRPRSREPGPFLYHGFEIFSDGWRPQIRQLCELLEAEAQSRRAQRQHMPWITVMEQRHAELRVAWGVALSDDLRKRIAVICAEKCSICSVCGQPGQPTASAFGMVRCPVHTPRTLQNAPPGSAEHSDSSHEK
jgi:hypothetical protein